MEEKIRADNEGTFVHVKFCHARCVIAQEFVVKMKNAREFVKESKRV